MYEVQKSIIYFRYNFSFNNNHICTIFPFFLSKNHAQTLPAHSAETPNPRLCSFSYPSNCHLFSNIHAYFRLLN